MPRDFEWPTTVHVAPDSVAQIYRKEARREARWRALAWGAFAIAAIVFGLLLAGVLK